MRHLFVLFFGILLTVHAGVANADENSRGLPETREPFSISPASWAQPKWSITGAKAIGVKEIALGDGVVALSLDGRICAFSDARGKRLWCTSDGSRPVFAGGVIAYASATGSVQAVEAPTGKALWHYRFPTALRADGRGIPYLWAVTVDTAVWPVRDHFLIASNNNGTNAGANYGEVDANGHLLWSTRFVGSVEEPVISGPYVVQKSVASGAYMQWTQHVFATGIGGGPRFVISDAMDVIDVRGDVAYISMEQQTANLHQLTFELRGVSLRDGHMVSDYHFSPDVDRNSAFVMDGTLRGIPPAVSIVSNRVYGTIGPKLYRYDLAPETAQQPLLLSATGSLVAVSTSGNVFIARKDGVWMLTPRDQDILARLVAPATHSLSSIARSASEIFIAFDDGEIRGIDIDNGITRFRAHGCGHPELRVISDDVFASCSGQRSTLMVFRRRV